MCDALLISVSVCLYLFVVYLLVLIFKKAGLGYWGLAAVIPLMLLPLLIVLAFSEWPTAEKAKEPNRWLGPWWYSPS